MKKIYIYSAFALALAACDKNEGQPDLTADPIQVFASIGESETTRAADDKWTAGDEIGITLSMPNGSRPHINMLYTTDGVTAGGGTSFTGNPIYFYNPMTLTAYYPFSGIEGTAAGTIEANTKAENQSESNQPKIDFLWDRQTEFQVVNNKPEINFKFTHKMSKLTFIFKSGDGMDVRKITSYTIDGLVMEGTFDTETGICALKENASEESLDVDLTTGTVVDGEPQAPLILFPQAPGTNKVLLHIYSNELDDATILQHYTCTLPFGDGELKPGMNYLYTITVNKAGINIEKSSITDWFDFPIPDIGASSTD